MGRLIGQDRNKVVGEDAGILVGATDAEILRNIVRRLRHGINTVGRREPWADEGRAAISANPDRYRVAAESFGHAFPPDWAGYFH
ncbi:hypothetical protein EFR01_34710 [Sinorhizobium fredii]|nr:hypothetical protein EFR01_34710 [Sinorhizobium fredii]GLS08487.1 hypothetical protein GCM10007864_21160 [Sinorhizobium fredii]